MAGSSNYLDNIPNAAPEHSLLNSLLEDNLYYKNFKNTTQRNAIAKILKRDSDVIVSLPKDHGRTTCFIFPILICQQKVSIVFVGQLSRIDSQISRLNRREVYVEIIDAKTTLEKYDFIKKTVKCLSTIKSSYNSLFYVTPDVVSTDNFLNLIQHLIDKESLGYMVVDASYCENEWIIDQAEEFFSLYSLQELRNTYKNIPWVVTTSRASYEIVYCISTKLCLRTLRSDIPKNSIPWFAMDIEDEDVQIDR